MTTPSPIERLIRESVDLHEKIAVDAGLKVALVRCRTCDAELSVDGARCLREGWPLCCEETMMLVRR